MKKIINRPEAVVPEMLAGLVEVRPELELIPKYKVVKKRALDPDKVTLISGGGSGHEPAHAGYIGKGMLDAAVCGDVFASPSQIQVFQAIRATKSGKGTLLIIKNYSGDMMNFKNGAHLAGEEGIQVDYVKVEDDIAVQDSLYTVGRRGVAGTVFVHKIAGAAAEKGLTLPEVKAAAQHAADSVRSIGFAYSSCTVPASGVPTFDLGEGEMEYGVGIHGEPGRSREKTLSADELASRMAGQLMNDMKLALDGEIALMINGFGGTPLMELYVLNHAVMKVLDEKGIRVCRAFAGNYMTSIDMQGASVTFLKLDDELKGLLDAPSDAPAFRVSGDELPARFSPVAASGAKPLPEAMASEWAWRVVRGDRLTLDNIAEMVRLMAECVLQNEVPFCKMDSYAGDGDFGMSVAKGFREVKREWNGLLEHHRTSIGDFLGAVSLIIMEHCGGASGPIWGSAFRAAGFEAGGVLEMDLPSFAQMIQAAVKGIQNTGERSFGRGAVVGDKTLIDALVPSADSLAGNAENRESLETALKKAAQAAVNGAERTKEIVARMGRAGAVGERSLGYPDAGAYALGVIFTHIANGLIYA
jgi:dihydroxyacetone kinase